MRAIIGVAIALGLVLGAGLSVAGYRLAPVRYASNGRIHVAPTGYPILRETEDTGPLVGYAGVVTTHAILVKTDRVVEQALEDPLLAALPIAQLPNARERILEGLTVNAARTSLETCRRGMDLERSDPHRGFRLKQRLLQLCAY